MPVVDKLDDWSSKASVIYQRRSNRRRWMIIVSIGVFAPFVALQWGILSLLRGELDPDIPVTIANTAILFTVSFLITQFIIYRMVSISVYRLIGQVLSTWLIVLATGFAVMLLLRFDYSFWYATLTFVVGTASLAVFAAYLVERHTQTVGIPRDILSADITMQDMGMFVPLDGPTLPETAIDALVVDQRYLNDPVWTPFLSWCAINAVPVLFIADYIERHTGKIDMSNFALGDALRIRTLTPYLSLKRLVDVTVASVALFILAVPLVIMALVIRIESKGSAIFTQRRLGRGGRPFTIYKFRSMRTDAEVRGAQFAASSDPRITRVGRYIRKSRIDELPQLLNVIRGDMSLIGPRPEQVDLMDELVDQIPLFPLRHSVRPGITGWAQVCQGYADDVDSTREKIAYDLFYIKNVSLILDLSIVLRTIRIIISGFGAR